MYACIHEIHVYSMYIQNWEYNRDELTYLRDIGEGHFGKVLLMRGKVESIMWFMGLCCGYWARLVV